MNADGVNLPERRPSIFMTMCSSVSQTLVVSHTGNDIASDSYCTAGSRSLSVSLHAKRSGCKKTVSYCLLIRDCHLGKEVLKRMKDALSK